MDVMKIRKEGRCGYYRTHKSRVTTSARLIFRSLIGEMEINTMAERNLGTNSLIKQLLVFLIKLTSVKFIFCSHYFIMIVVCYEDI
jgi:hypothetical protein